MTKLTTDELKTLEELDAKATPAPWQLGEDDVNPELMTGPRNTEGSFNYIGNGYDRTDDAFDNKLCVAVRNALPRLLAHIRTLEADLDEARKYAAPENAKALSWVKKPCTKHNQYWTTATGGCMACRADDAETKLKTALSDLDAARREARAARDRLSYGYICPLTIQQEYAEARAANPMESKP